MSRWLSRRVIGFAHQGGSFEGPSSTIAAIDHALGVGATAIELDVHATRDRRVVVCHDHTVDRTTNHHGAIAGLTLDELREMDNAYWWIDGDVVTPGQRDEAYLTRGRAPRDHRYGVATLEEVCATFPNVLLNLDIKGVEPDVEPYEELLAEELTRFDRLDSVIVASFHDVALRRFRTYAPEVATSSATNETASFYFSMLDETPVVPPVVAFQVPARFEGIDVVTEMFVTASHAAGVAVHVWTINDEAEMERLLDLGVDGLVSDRPSLLARVLARRALTWDRN